MVLFRQMVLKRNGGPWVVLFQRHDASIRRVVGYILIHGGRASATPSVPTTSSSADQGCYELPILVWGTAHVET